jgi:hypothetical protein
VSSLIGCLDFLQRWQLIRPHFVRSDGIVEEGEQRMVRKSMELSFSDALPWLFGQVRIATQEGTARRLAVILPVSTLSVFLAWLVEPLHPNTLRLSFTACKFINGAVCDPSSHACCTSSCSFAPSTQMCRAAVDDKCDIPEYCTGSAGTCPEDKTEANGECLASVLSCTLPTTSGSRFAVRPVCRQIMRFERPRVCVGTMYLARSAMSKRRGEHEPKQGV